jgi:hypothetical protein
MSLTATPPRIGMGKLDGLQMRVPTTVTRFLFYDPEKARPRS